LAAFARSETAGLHPSPHPKPDLWTSVHGTRRARRHLKSLPSRTWRRGVSRFEPNQPIAARCDAKRNPVFTRLCRPCD